MGRGGRRRASFGAPGAGAIVRGSMFRALAAHRDLLWLLTLRELRVRYARALLGAAWAVLLPLAMMGVFLVLDFGRLFPEGHAFSEVPYALYAFCGLLFWNHFSASLTQATPSLVISGQMIKKSAFPREFIPLSRVLALLVDVAVGGVFLAGILLWSGRPVGAAVLAVPLVFLLQVAFTTGLALLLAAGNMFFRDVHYLVQVGVVLAMFATSVVYPVAPSHPVARAVLAWNPMSAYLDAYRGAILLGRWPTGEILPRRAGRRRASSSAGGSSGPSPRASRRRSDREPRHRASFLAIRRGPARGRGPGA